LTNGHTHFILIGENDTDKPKGEQTAKKYKWGDETALKFDIAKRIAQGRTKMAGGAACKIVTVLCGDNAQCELEISTSLNMGIPVVVLEGSAISNVIMSG
jgi:hypothetical protein